MICRFCHKQIEHEQPIQWTAEGYVHYRCQQKRDLITVILWASFGFAVAVIGSMLWR